jgi:hypothetical protein
MPQQPGRTAPLARRGTRTLAWALLALTLALLAATLVIGLTGHEYWAKVVGFMPIVITLALVGTLVAARTGNRLGWLFLAAAAVSAISVLASVYAARSVTAELPGAAWAGWTLIVSLGIVQPLLFLIPLLFPDGRPPSRRWWPVVWVAIIAGLVVMVTSALSNVNFSSNFPKLRDPVTVVAPLGTAYNFALEVGLLVFVVGAVSIIVRFRRSGQEQRLQLKWFMYASIVAAVVIFGVSGFSNSPLPATEIVFPLIPAAVGIAMLKYRLYDIDRLISRTLAYAIVTGLLVGVYAGLVLLATQVFGLHTPVAVAAATLAAAALFSPVRHRVQQVVDRRFNRVRYDADQTASEFAARLRDAVDLHAIRADLLTVVNRAVEPAHLSVWIAESGRDRG